MSELRNIDFKSVYRTGRDDLFNDFYKKALAASIKYDRAVGYFSSQLIASTTKGLGNFIKSNGFMRLIIGHPLDHDEFAAVKHGANLRELNADLSEKLLKLFEETNIPRLQLLAWLVASNRLEIKFALRRIGMYHEKIGIFTDSQGNKVVFQGSANETPHGMMIDLNAESISVYKSWQKEVYEEYGREYETAFNNLWNNQEKDIITLDVPSETYRKISQIGAKLHEKMQFSDEFEDELKAQDNHHKSALPFVPSMIGGNEFIMRKHQTGALQAWRANDFKGVLKLATGSGKTITSIYGAVKIFEARQKQNHPLCLIVAVPYIELAAQWVENLNLFGIYPTECFESKKKWQNKLETQVNHFNAGVSQFFACVVVNKTLGTELFKTIVSKLNTDSMMLIGDECHNHGSKSLNESLPPAFYRMGLSATPFRCDDDEIDSPFPDDAKERILSFYGDIVSEYTLGDAITDRVLTPYEYHIVPVYLTAEEQEKYDVLSERIAKLLVQKGTGKLSKIDSENLTRLCGQRSRLLGSAKQKLDTLRHITQGISTQQKHHSIFYAGEGRIFSEEANLDQRVIDEVSKVLTENGWKTAQFTGHVSKQSRRNLMDSFKDSTLDALVAMKVLDEGIDVPVCKTAYILASTRNPRQYVQRRGRILRKYPGKDIAKIYDFVILPSNDSPYARRLKLAEAERVNDFAVLAVNKLEIETAIQENGLSYVNN